MQADAFTFTVILLATAVSRRGPAIGNTQVAIIKHRNSHPDKANHKKKIV